jgi:hypothetical protein
MSEKRNAADFIDDTLNGRLPIEVIGAEATSLADTARALGEYYEFSEDEIRRELPRFRDRIEVAIGMPLTEDQLLALTGGKSEKQSNRDLYIGMGVAMGGTAIIGGGFLTGIAIALAVIK